MSIFSDFFPKFFNMFYDIFSQPEKMYDLKKDT